MREPLESYLRDEPLPEAGHLLLRGSPLTLDKFRADAARAARRFSYQGEPCPGLSTELARTGGEADQLMAGPRLTGRHHIARLPVEDALACGFVLLPTFTAPHYTVVMGSGGTATLDAFAELASRDVIVNPYYRGVRG